MKNKFYFPNKNITALPRRTLYCDSILATAIGKFRGLKKHFLTFNFNLFLKV